MRQLAPRFATPVERTAVEQFDVDHGNPLARGTVTGIELPLLRNEEGIVVRMYSGGCLHNLYPIRHDQLLARRPDPR